MQFLADIGVEHVHDVSSGLRAGCQLGQDAGLASEAMVEECRHELMVLLDRGTVGGVEPPILGTVE